MAKNGAPMRKSFPVFDCDAHINDPPEIWTQYVAPKDRELVRQSYWRDDQHTIVNGRSRSTAGGSNGDFSRYNPITISARGWTEKRSADYSSCH